MTISFRRLFMDVSTYASGDILLKAVNFFTIPVYTRYFSPGEYGTWSYVVTAAGLMNAVLLLGGDSAYARFFFEARTPEKKQLVTSTWFAFLTMWSLAVVLLCIPLAGVASRWSFGTERESVLFVLALLSAPAMLVNNMCGQALRNEFRPRLFVALNLFSALLIVGLSIFAGVYLRMGVAGVLGGSLAALVILVPIRLWTVRRLLQPVFSGSLLVDMLKFGVPLVPVSLAYWVFASSDKVVLGKLSTLEQVGLYSVATSTTSLLGSANAALGQAWSPYLISIYEEHREIAPVFFGSVMTYILVGFGLLCVAITTFAHELLVVLSTPVFYPAAIAFGPLALGFMAYASTQVTAAGIAIAKQTKYFVVFSALSAALNLVLNVALVPRWGLLASAWATTASYVFLTVGYLVVSQRLYRVVYEKKRVARVVVLTFAFTIAAPLLPQGGPLAAVLMKILFCAAYAGLLVITGVTGEREWKAVLGSIRAMSPRRVERPSDESVHY
jgi:O-antigen/teichoic acid export membrane protein